jgi:hypothetical protein
MLRSQKTAVVTETFTAHIKLSYNKGSQTEIFGLVNVSTEVQQLSQPNPS